MEAYWNKSSLNRPPTTTWCCAADEFDSTGFFDNTEKIIKNLESQTFLKTEAAILSRLIYRMKSKFRNDKGLKNMEKMNRALLNYLKLSLEKEYKYLADNMECGEEFIILPSRQMLQFVLVRTQSFAKLMCRIESTAEQAGNFFKTRISLGQAWNISVVAYAIISRIWMLSRHLTKSCCKWYNRMYKYHDKLKMVGVSWLPENQSLPKDLKMWLYVPWIDEDTEKIPEKQILSDGIFNLIMPHDNTEDVEFAEEKSKDESKSADSSLLESIEISTMPEKSNISRIEMKNETIPLTKFALIGERISRDEFAADLSKQLSIEKSVKKQKIVEAPKDTTKIHKKKSLNKIGKIKKKKITSTDDIENKSDVLKFIKLDSYPGLDKLQWKILQNDVSKLLIKLKKYESSSDMRKQQILMKKIIRRIRDSTN